MSRETVLALPGARFGLLSPGLPTARVGLIVVVPLLVESGTWKTRVDRVLTVDCTVETQIARVMRRNGFTREQVLAIIAQQATREARLAAADDVVVNDVGATLETLARDVGALHQTYLGLAAEKAGKA